MLHYTIIFSDLVGGFLGIVGSMILAYPYFSDVADRRQWELLLRFRRLMADRPLEPQEQEAFSAIRDSMIDDRLGHHLQFRRVTIWGFVLLLAAFVFMTIASFARLEGN